MRRQRDIIQLAHVLLGLCERQAEASAPDAQATMGEQLRTMAGKIAGHFPDRTKVEQALVQLGAVQNSDVYSGLRATMDPANDIRTVRKHQRAALKKLSALAPALLDATAPVWKCVGLTTINRALVPHLITLASSPDEPQLGATADKLLRFIADVFPEMLKSSSSELFDVSELRGSDVRLAEERLALMVKFAKAVPRAVPGSTDLQELLAGLVRTGTLRQAKYAAFLLTQMEGSGALCGVLAGDMVDNLDNALLERRAPSFAALARFAQYAPLAFAIYADRVSQFLVQTVLMGTPPPPPADGVADDKVMADGKENAAPEWVERESLDDAGLTKVYAVKILTNWLVGTDRHALTRDGVQTVLGVLRALVRNGGEIQPGTHSGSAHRPHVLLAAAACMVKLARLPHLERLLSQQDALSLALVAQDTCYEVRARFLLRKLVPALVAGRIHVRFVPTLFL
ncbi:Sister chromatid cohesion protein pds5, partial [Linderina macrospora]